MKKLYVSVWIGLIVALFVGSWWSGAQTASGFRPGRGFEKIADHFQGGLTFFAVTVSVAIIAGLITWMAKDGLSTKELVLSVLLIISWVIIITLLGWWSSIWHGVWSRAFLSVIVVSALTFGGAGAITYINRR